ncbi:hypothetical protein RYH80_15380 [Halobaculum sp. MBLA0147]|uniref:hypothetical protein n=1 Tax=Halobaculum sp. MBLA0147 TaxID=3079934 RepID=UPI003525DCEF
MSTEPTGPVSYLRSKSEFMMLGVYIVALVGLAQPVANLIVRGWWEQPHSVVYQLVTLVADVGLGLATIEAFVFGFGAVALVLMTIDRAKRIQAALLWLGIAVAATQFVTRGFLFKVAVNPLAHLPVFVVGAIVGARLLLPLAAWRALTNGTIPSTRRFPRAPLALVTGLAMVLIGAWVEAHVVFPVAVTTLPTLPIATLQRTLLEVTIVPNRLAIDSVAAMALLAVTRRFVAYKSTRSVVVLGPKGSGKTTFGRGALADCERSAGVEMNGSDNMLSIGGHGTDGDTATVSNTRENIERSLTMQRGQLFPTDLTISTLDHAGENLKGLAMSMEGKEEIEGLGRVKVEELRQEVVAADTIILLIDTAAYQKGEPAGLDAYETILGEIDPETQVLLAASKADYLAEEFRQARQLNPFDSTNLPVFTEWVSTKLGDHNAIRALLNAADQDTIYPTYFASEAVADPETVDGVVDREPVTDNGSRHPYGFVELLKQIR